MSGKVMPKVRAETVATPLRLVEWAVNWSVSTPKST